MSDSDKPFIYPNPITNGELNIKLKNPSLDFDYIIYNVVGGIVKQGELSSIDNKLDVSKVATGVYVVRMNSGNMVSSHKIIIK